MAVVPENISNAPTPTLDSQSEVIPTPEKKEILVGAGDIGVCGSDVDEKTANLINNIAGTVFTVGDNAYEYGSEVNFNNCYQPSWGRFKDRTYPVPGNHDYVPVGASPYFKYFGEKAGPTGLGYYSYELGDWHIVALNSNLALNKNSAQLNWLEEDLEIHPNKCTLAYWHHAVFSSGQHGNSRFPDLLELLYEKNVDVVVNGHDHDYERFARLNADGNVDNNGIRFFVVGTGGAYLRDFLGIKTGSEVRSSDTHGVIKFELSKEKYSWEFVPVETNFHDEGQDNCH